MDILSEMQAAELEVRQIMSASPASAMTGIVEAYNRRSEDQREAFVSVLAARVALAPTKEARGFELVNRLSESAGT